MSKIRVGIIAGGMSSEHEISCVSAGGVLSAIDRERFEPVLIGITKSGKWLLPHANQVLEIKGGVLPEITDGEIKSFEEIVSHVDVLFPLLHGPFGEDGTFQGLCEMAKIRYVGSGVLASSVAMDKSFAKPIFASHSLEVAPGVVVTSQQWAKSKSVDVSALAYPLFVKPARGGSSRGTTKVKESTQLVPAIEEAFQFDTKVMIETGIIGREIECAVLETQGVADASPLGEIKILGNHEFYDFDAKYLDGSTQVVFPDDLPRDVQESIQTLAIEAFHALGCEGLARVDFFYANGKIVINEINTMPGFTPTSVFPKLWAKAGISYSEIISRLIDGALTK
jgi:D-alanine-D-alanine ligase